MKSNLKDRFTVSFYEETYNDKILLEALNRMCQPRFRGNKVKELAFEALKQQMPDMVKEIEKYLKGNKEVEDEIAVTKQKKKKGIPGLNIVASSRD
jgi:hypothetical protein